jgi:hypothetical protein
MVTYDLPNQWPAREKQLRDNGNFGEDEHFGKHVNKKRNRKSRVQFKSFYLHLDELQSEMLKEKDVFDTRQLGEIVS